MGILSFLIASLAGAGIMYLFDPQMGNRRRALLRDKATKIQNQASDYAENMTERVSDRARGTVAEMKNRVDKMDVDDETLAARVKSELGHHVSPESTVDVSVSDGVVTMTGDVFQDEEQILVARVQTTAGVRAVLNRMQTRQRENNVPDFHQ